MVRVNAITFCFLVSAGRLAQSFYLVSNYLGARAGLLHACVTLSLCTLFEASQ